MRSGRVFVLPGPRSKFTEIEMNAIRNFVNNGGNVLVMLGEGGENKSNTNINFLIEEYGVMVNNGSDGVCVERTFCVPSAYDKRTICVFFRRSRTYGL